MFCSKAVKTGGEGNGEGTELCVEPYTPGGLERQDSKPS